MFDNHIHSSFSGDSEMSPLLAIQTALTLGLKGIAFTDHLDYDYPGLEDLFLLDFPNYFSCLNRLKKDYDSKIKILRGIEVGVQEHLTQQNEAMLSQYDFDFVIASIHIIDGQDPFQPGYFSHRTKKDVFLRYLAEVENSLLWLDDFDVVGHIGYIRRYSPYDDKSMPYIDYRDLFDSILTRVITLGKGIEINTSGYREGLGSPMPERDILLRYKELGGEIITIGSDAHKAQHIAHSFKLAQKLLLDLGFRYTTHFENRKPVFDVI